MSAVGVFLVFTQVGGTSGTGGGGVAGWRRMASGLFFIFYPTYFLYKSGLPFLALVNSLQEE